MNNEYDDELEHGRSRKSRRRTDSTESRSESRQTNEDEFMDIDDPGTTGSSRRSVPNGRSASSMRAARREKKSKRKKIIMMVVAECLALCFIFSYAYVARAWNLIQRPAVKAENVLNPDLDIDTLEKMKGYWTIAVFGVDSRTNNVGKGTNADVNMICNINMDTGEIKLVSVFRDTYLNISEKNSYNKINQSYAQGGPEQAMYAMNKNMDLNITDYVTFNWKAVADAINILGGVDVEISKAEFHYINSFITETVKVTGVPSVHLKKAGMNHLDGVQAVAYGRLRLMDTDFARTERQRKIIQLAFDKAKKADIAVLNNLMVTIFPQVATGMDMKDLSNVVFNASKYQIGETSGFPTARGNVNMVKKGDCVIPQTLESNVVELHKFLFGEEIYSPSNSVKTISKKIAADTGMYKEGTKIDKVPTDGGYIPKPTTAPKETTEAETRETKESSEIKETTAGVRPGETTERETDENGEPVQPGINPTRPSSTSPSSTSPTESTRPSETSPSTTTPGATRPAAPTTSPTRPSGTKPASTTSPSDQNGPGTAPSTAPTTEAPSTEAPMPTVPPAPIESESSAGNSVGPGGSSGNDTGVVVGTPGS